MVNLGSFFAPVSLSFKAIKFLPGFNLFGRCQESDKLCSIEGIVEIAGSGLSIFRPVIVAMGASKKTVCVSVPRT